MRRIGNECLEMLYMFSQPDYIEAGRLIQKTFRLFICILLRILKEGCSMVNLADMTKEQAVKYRRVNPSEQQQKNLA